jgi:hypothetical protein
MIWASIDYPFLGGRNQWEKRERKGEGEEREASKASQGGIIIIIIIIIIIRRKSSSNAL